MENRLKTMIDHYSFFIFGFVLVLASVLFYRWGYDRGHIPKAELCADELSELVRSREQYIECDVDLQACKIKGFADCTFDRCQPMCIQASRKAVLDYVALEKEIVCSPIQ